MIPEIAFIYIVSFFFVFLFAKFGLHVNNRDIAYSDQFSWNKYYFISFLILFLFIGTRYGVGRDFYHYIDKYENEDQPFLFGKSDEFGFLLLISVLNSLHLDYKSFFLVTSFITVLLLFKTFKNANQLLPIGILVFCIGGMYGFVINGIRQGIAIMAFYNALRFNFWDVRGKEKLWNLFWILFYIALGTLFHYSILIFAPLLLILNKRLLSYFTPIILVIVVISGFMISSFPVFNIIPNTIFEIFPKYAIDVLELNPYYESNKFGFGAALYLSANLLPLIFYDKIKKELPNSSQYFVLFAFGTSLLYAFSKYILISRIINYFSFCSIFVFAYTSYYFINQSNNRLIYRLLGLYILLALVIQTFYPFSDFLEIQIQEKNFSLWSIPLTK